MSVINRMLSDLERRGALSGSEAAAFELRPVQPGKRPATAPMLAVVAAIAIAGAWVWTAGPSPKRAPVLAEVPPAVAALAQPDAAPVQAPAVQDVTAGAPDVSLRLSALAPASERRTAPARKPAAAPRSPAAGTAPSAVPATSAAVSTRGAETATATAATPPAATEAAIDKRNHQPTPRERAAAEFSRAVALMQQGRAGEAIEGLNSTLQIYPGHDAARQVLAALLVEARRAAEAEQVLEEGLRQKSGNPRLALALARIQVERGAWDAALETLRRSEAGATGDADYQGFLGSVLQRLSRHAEAIPCYIAALRLAPQSGLWYMGLGISLEAEGRAGDARESFQRAKSTGTLSPELVAFVDQRLARLTAKP